MTDVVQGAPAAATAPEPAHKPRRFELTLFALPHAPLGALGLPPIVFLPPYYAAQLGIPLEVVSALFLAARALDIVIDPLLGEWQDRTRARIGRRKLWMILSSPILMFAVWLAFIGVGPGVNVFGLAATIFTLYAMFAVMIIAHLGWASELRADYHGRTNVLGGVQIAAMIGATLILLLPGIVRAAGWGDDADAVHVMGWTILITLPIAVLVAVLFVREPDIPVHEKISLKLAIGAIFSNKHLRGVLAPDLLLGVAQGVSGGLFIFYFQYTMGFESQSQILLFFYFIAGVLGVPLWMAVGKRTGKHRALQLACLYAAVVTLLVQVLPHHNPLTPPLAELHWRLGEWELSIELPPWEVVATGIGMMIAGLHQGSSNMLLRAMLADVIDADRLKTGQARAGLFNSLLLITSKIGLATGPVTYAVLALFGFQTALGAGNSSSAMAALNAMFIYAPATIFVLSAIALRIYRLDEAAQRAIRAELDAVQSAQRAQSQ
jgi:Na+/melibiose symporter-like transporter